MHHKRLAEVHGKVLAGQVEEVRSYARVEHAAPVLVADSLLVEELEGLEAVEDRPCPFHQEVLEEALLGHQRQRLDC